MSEDSVKINGVVQVGLFLILGAVYIGILYFIATGAQAQLLENSTIVSLTGSTTASLQQYGHQSAIILLSAGIIFLSVITGMLISDIARKFSIISLLLLALVTAIDLVPIKLIVDGVPIQ